MLTPIDIREKEFDRGRGYTREVRTFLAKVAGEYEVLYSKNAELTDRIAQLEALLNNYENMEDSMKNALVLAQRTADSTIEAANKEAENILLNARIKSEELLIESVDKNNRIKLANKNLMDRFQLYKDQFQSFLEQQKNVLDATTIVFEEEDIDVHAEKVYPNAVDDANLGAEEYYEDEEYYDEEDFIEEEYDEEDLDDYEEVTEIKDLDDDTDLLNEEATDKVEK